MTRSSRASIFLIFPLLLEVLQSVVFGQRPEPQLTSLFPPGCSPVSSGVDRGTVEVQVQGTDLVDIRELFFSHPGIVAKRKLYRPHAFLEERPEPGKFLVSVAADVPLGIYEARLVGSFGVSNPRAFVIGKYVEQLEISGNQEPEKGMLIQLNQTINGRVDSAQGDYFKVMLRKDQQVTFDCYAHRIDSKLDGSLSVLGPSNNLVATSRNALGGDPVITLRVNQDGEYIIRLVDHTYRGGSDFFYRLTVHDGPHVDYVFPPAGTAGASSPFTLFGVNLPENSLTEMITLPEGPMATRDRPLVGLVAPETLILDAFSAKFACGLTIPIYHARTPVVLEQEGAENESQPQEVVPPLEIAGRFFPAYDQDSFQFFAKKDTVYRIEVVAHRLGQTVDPLLVIERVTKNDQGVETTTEIATVDDPADRSGRIGSSFDTSTDDPSYRFVADQDGLFRIRVWDQFSGPHAKPKDVYRLLIQKEEPDYRLAAVPERISSPMNANVVLGGTASLSRGGRMLLHIFVERQQGFQGEIELIAEGLPDGVTGSPTVVPAEARSAALILHASENAAPSTTPIRIVGKSRIAGLPVYRSARFGIPVWSTDNRRITPPFYRATRDLLLSVTDHLEVASLQADEERIWETARGGKLQIPLNLIRRGGFKERLVFVPFDVPNEFKPANLEIPPEEKRTVLSLDLKDPKTKPGMYTFYLRADTKSQFVTNQAEVNQATIDQERVEAKLAELAQAIKHVREGSASSISLTPPTTIQELEEKSKSLQAIKGEFERRLSEANQRNAPVERTYPIVSSPITVRIAATPISIASTTSLSVKRGDKSSIEVTLQRKYGYSAATSVRTEVPKELAGVVISETTIAAGEERGILELTTTAETPPGNYELLVRAVGKFNSVDVDACTIVPLRVE